VCVVVVVVVVVGGGICRRHASCACFDALRILSQGPKENKGVPQTEGEKKKKKKKKKKL